MRAAGICSSPGACTAPRRAAPRAPARICLTPLPTVHPHLRARSKAPERSVTTRLLVCAFIGSVHAMQYGWAIGVINFPQTQISLDLGLCTGDCKTSSWWWAGGVVAAFCVAGFAGSHFGGSLADSMGRRRLIVALNVPFVVGGALGWAAGFVKGAAGLYMLLASRVLVGAACGAGSVVTPMYLGEIATPATRGAFGALFQFQITVFILIVQLASMPGALSSASTWGYLFAISGVFGLVGLLLAPFLLESPKWLLKQGRRDHAQSTLAQLRGVSQADAIDDLLALEEEDDAPEDAEAGAVKEQAPTMTLSQVLADSYLRMPLLILSILMVTQQFSGINAVFYYSSGFFKVRQRRCRAPCFPWLLLCLTSFAPPAPPPILPPCRTRASMPQWAPSPRASSIYSLQASPSPSLSAWGAARSSSRAFRAWGCPRAASWRRCC